MLMNAWAAREVIVDHQLHGRNEMWLSVAYFHLALDTWILTLALQVAMFI